MRTDRNLNPVHFRKATTYSRRVPAGPSDADRSLRKPPEESTLGYKHKALCFFQCCPLLPKGFCATQSHRFPSCRFGRVRRRRPPRGAEDDLHMSALSVAWVGQSLGWPLRLGPERLRPGARCSQGERVPPLNGGAAASKPQEPREAQRPRGRAASSAGGRAGPAAGPLGSELGRPLGTPAPATSPEGGVMPP